jgi:hypothetical protein
MALQQRVRVEEVSHRVFHSLQHQVGRSDDVISLLLKSTAPAFASVSFLRSHEPRQAAMQSRFVTRVFPVHLPLWHQLPFHDWSR